MSNVVPFSGVARGRSKHEANQVVQAARRHLLAAMLIDRRALDLKVARLGLAMARKVKAWANGKGPRPQTLLVGGTDQETIAKLHGLLRLQSQVAKISLQQNEHDTAAAFYLASAKAALGVIDHLAANQPKQARKCDP